MLIFDMDGTLIDSNGIWRQVDEAFLAKRGYPYTREYYEGVAHTIFPMAAKFTKAYCHLEEFHIFELPVLVGVSRKSMIYKLLGGTPQDSLNGTTILDTVALMKGAHILRVHDVREAVETVRIVEKIKKESHVF